MADPVASRDAIFARQIRFGGGTAAPRLHYVGGTTGAKNPVTPMRQPRFPILVDTGRRRVRAGFSAPASEEPAEISLHLRDKGWSAYSIHFDAQANAWIAQVFNPKTRHAA